MRKLLAAALLVPAAAAAADETSPPPSLEEVIVTAERRSTNLQTTGISASVLSGADLANKGIMTVDGLQAIAPSVVIENFGQGNNFNIRGIGKGEHNTQTSTGVITYRDGAIFLFVLNIIGLGCGPLLIGMASDHFALVYGTHALRIALLCLAPVFVLVFLVQMAAAWSLRK